jgi:hypothetical protein
MNPEQSYSSIAVCGKGEPEVGKGYRYQATGIRSFMLKPVAFPYKVAHPFLEPPQCRRE